MSKCVSASKAVDLALRGPRLPPGVDHPPGPSTGRFREHHTLMTRLLLNRIDQHNAAIQHLEQRIEQKINSLDAPRDLLTSIPGVSRTVADIIIAETGADMTAFPSAAPLCS
jgi:transposase